jgi:hypothetical protein
MSDGRGVFAHARCTDPQPERGYCLDDAARALVVACREPCPSPELQLFARRLLAFTVSALHGDGTCHHRMISDGVWGDAPGVGDWWGRAAWGLGVAAVHAPTPAARAMALLGFRAAARRRSQRRRAMAFAALGAGELLLARPDEVAARELLLDAVVALSGIAADPSWPWPEPRLTHSNATIAEALLVAGEALPDPVARSRGLYLLHFLLGTEIRHGRLSPTPVMGRGPRDLRPGFDQRPVEAAAIGAACAQAYESTTRIGCVAYRSPGRGSPATTTPPRRCSTRAPVPVSTGCSEVAEAPTRAPSRLLPRWPRSSMCGGSCRWTDRVGPLSRSNDATKGRVGPSDRRAFVSALPERCRRTVGAPGLSSLTPSASPRRHA